MKNLLWIDLEMTGLDEKTHHIMEIAAVVTDIQLQSRGEFHKVVFQPADVLAMMDDWCKKTHGESGLTAAIPNGTPIQTVESQFIEFLKPHFKSDERIVIAGNSINNDRRFIDAYMPALSKKLHYRMVDVSSFKEIFRDRYGIKFEKKNQHRAVDDIHESIRELGTYLTYIKIP